VTGTETFFSLVERWEGSSVVVRHDRPTGSWIFIALHDHTLGRPVGGCRLTSYRRPEDGLRDALRLAEGMTLKWAVMDLPFGGGKSVLAVPPRLSKKARTGLLHRFGELLESLDGVYGTGADLGTTVEDMRTIASRTKWVVGLPDGPELPTDPGPYTALGVWAGIKAALAHRFGSADPAGRRVLVQGVGNVGDPLARMVVADGGQVLLTDTDQDKAFALAVELGATVVTPEEAYDAPCTVYAPCAVGATLNQDTLPRLRCAIVAGSANNQLADDRCLGLLEERDILYAPDYVINGGGAMAFGLLHLGERDLDVLDERVRGIGGTLREIFQEAEARGESPVEGARRRALAALERARESSD